MGLLLLASSSDHPNEKSKTNNSIEIISTDIISKSPGDATLPKSDDSRTPTITIASLGIYGPKGRFGVRRFFRKIFNEEKPIGTGSGASGGATVASLNPTMGIITDGKENSLGGKEDHSIVLSHQTATELSTLIEKSESYYMMPPTAQIKSNGESFTIIVEIWQSQKYWRPLSKWAEAWNLPEFVNNINYYASSKFPTEFSWIAGLSRVVIDCPGSFEWAPGSEWSVDMSKRFGNTCVEGWMYGDSFKSILEDMKAKRSSGVPDSSNITKKRRRVWTRALRFVPTRLE